MDTERIGKYLIDGELGRGTMGTVYRAHDPVLRRYVALKTLAVQGSHSEETLERFQREAQAAALLNHPNIVTVHDFGEERGLLYMAMELLEGTDLRDAIDGDVHFSLEEKLDVVDGVLAALDYAHSKGVVHRDVKPANVQLIGPWGEAGGTGERQVKIMDFGLARVSTSEMTQEGIVLGTPNYMSPEQALGDKVDGRSDLFSVGALLYELLTGHKPFEADSTPSVLFQVVHRQPPPVRRWAPETPAGIVTVVNRALEKDREKRFGSAGEMRVALAAARQAMAPLSKAPPLPVPRPARPEPPPLPSSATPAMSPPVLGSAPPPVPPRPRVLTPQPMAVPPGLRAGPAAPRPGAVRLVVRASSGPVALGASLAILLLALLTAGLWLRGARRPAPVPSPSASSAAVSALTQELVRKQVQLARRELEDKNYAAATAEAEGALKLAPADPEAAAVLATARERKEELERSIAEAHRLLEAGDTGEASRELSHALELDPRHPAAAELSAGLNSVFRAQADAAAASMREARSAALDAGATAWSLRAVDVGVSQAELLLGKGEFADATRMLLEARDAFDRARRAALERGEPTSAARAATAIPAPATPAPPAAAPSARPTPAGVVAAGTTPPAPAAADPPSPRGFDADETSVATPAAGGVEGFESSDVSSRRPPQFAGRLEFEVLPPTVRPGEPFVVRLHLRNEGRRPVKVRGVSLAAVVDGRRVPAAVKPLQREVGPQSRALVAEYSGVWSEAGSWALEAVVTADRDERISSRLRAN
jgi:serine/threonine-protein kinase